MSLSQFIKLKTNNKRFKSSFPRPNIKLKGILRSEPLCKSYSTVGIAIDYLIRFQLKYMFPDAKVSIWNAEKISPFYLLEFNKYLQRAKKHYASFLSSGRMSQSLVKSSIDLAKLETFYRTNEFYYPEDLGYYDKKVVEDINNILKNINLKRIEIKKRCILNPNFGPASEKIGGADADLIIDNKLIDIKTTKKLEISREMLNQIIGYYFLGRIGKVKGIRNWSTITELGFYFTRYDLLYTLPLESLIPNRKIESFENWFVKRLEKYSSPTETHSIKMSPEEFEDWFFAKDEDEKL